MASFLCPSRSPGRRGVECGLSSPTSRDDEVRLEQAEIDVPASSKTFLSALQYRFESDYDSGTISAGNFLRKRAVMREFRSDGS